jgi:5'-methylthioadenosine phosphorylase
MGMARIGVIGGSGFYEMDGLTDIEEVTVPTPFGDPVDHFTIGTLEGERVAFLPRHGLGHRFTPTELPVKAHIWAFKKLGVEMIISVSAVGSLRRKIEPLHLVIPDQLIDRTRNRDSTFFGKGIVAHIGVADPFCSALSKVLRRSAKQTDAVVHKGGTLVVIEGPAFSTRAESEMYRGWGADIIGMTALPEAKLAREAEICYATVACVTDYDVWHETEDDVTLEMVIANLQHNVEVAKQVVRGAVTAIADGIEVDCGCRDALANAIITAPERVPEYRKRDLAPILGRYMPTADQIIAAMTAEPAPDAPNLDAVEGSI